MAKRFGLTAQCIEDITNVFKLHPEIEEAVMFGSRAMGTYKKGSDIDIALKGSKVSFNVIGTVRAQLDELPYAYTYDIINYHKISNKSVVAHIDELGILFYKREEESSGWKAYKWGDLATLEYGKALQNYRTEEGSVPVFGTNGPIGTTTSPLCHFPSVIIGRKGAYRGIHYSNEPFYVIDTAFYLNPKVDFLNTKFAYYYLKTFDINSMDSGSAIPSTSRDEFYMLPAVIPNPKIQDQITAILSSLDDKIEFNLQMNQTLETMAQAIFKEWFVNFNFPGFDGKLVDGLPKGWRKGSIYELMEVIYGFPFKSALFNEEGSGKGLIRIRDLKNNATGFYTAEKADEKKYLIKAGDVLAGMDAEFIPSLWLGKNSWLNQRVCKFKPKFDFVNELFVLYSIRPLLERSQYGKVGTTVIHLGKGDIDKYEIIIPDKKNLNTVNTVFEPIHKRLIEIETESQTLAQIRDSLLPKLMTGKITVKA